MKLACLYFTENGERIASRIKQGLLGQVTLFNKQNYKTELDRIYSEYQGIIFISATGIAVRLSLSYLKQKSEDPAIIVVDDHGRFAISLVSGHLGGANELAHQIAELIHAQPVITTASDAQGIEAVDLYAKRHGFVIEDLAQTKKIITLMLEEKKIRIVFDSLNQKEKYNDLNYPHLIKVEEDSTESESYEEAQIHVTVKANPPSSLFKADLPYVILRPKVLHVGIGCKKGKSKYEIREAIEHLFQKHNLSLKSIQSLATIELKQNEQGILEVCKELGVRLDVFSADQIKKVQDSFQKSELVEKITGVTGVCEPCCFLAGGVVIVSKTPKNGIALSISKEE